MIRFSRRSVLGVSAAVTTTLMFPEWLARRARAGYGPRIRPDAGSAEGQTMLELYRNGVAAMKALPRHDPRSWLFQANIHGIPFPVSGDIDDILDPSQGATPEEQAEIQASRTIALGEDDNVFTNPLTATGVWRTCPHGDMNFLSWHRFYIFYLEEIIESLIERPFALPYWNYVDPSQRALPLAFRQEIDGSQAGNALFFTERLPGINDIANPTELEDRDVDIEEAFGNETTLGSPADVGFSWVVEGRPHGNVHVTVGTQRGMGRVPFAARDPIFYLHHCEIDRLWESWRRDGGDTVVSTRDPSDPAWLNQQFAFVTAEGERVIVTAADTLDMTGNLGYDYDNLQSPPTAPIFVASAEDLEKAAAMIMPAITFAADQRTVAESFASGPVAVVTDQPVEISLTPSISGQAADMLERSGTTTVYTLVLDDVTPEGTSSLSYDVYLSSGSDDNDERSFVGRFSLFGVGRMEDDDDQTPGHMAVSVPQTFNLTKLVESGEIDPVAPFSVTIEPVGEEEGTAVPVTIRDARVIAR